MVTFDHIDNIDDRYIRERMEALYNNFEMMAQCKVHEFRVMAGEEGRKTPRRQCRACGGVVPNYLYEWYERGLRDAFYVCSETVAEIAESREEGKIL